MNFEPPRERGSIEIQMSDDRIRELYEPPRERGSIEIGKHLGMWDDRLEPPRERGSIEIGKLQWKHSDYGSPLVRGGVLK